MSVLDPVMIRTAALGRRFGPAWAIRDMDLEVRRGEVLGLLGPNGAGKTTTVRPLTALIEPSEGTASVDGLDVRTDPDHVRALVGIPTETPGLYEYLSAMANPDFFGRRSLVRQPGQPATEALDSGSLLAYGRRPTAGIISR